MKAMKVIDSIENFANDLYGVDIDLKDVKGNLKRILTRPSSLLAILGEVFDDGSTYLNLKSSDLICETNELTRGYIEESGLELGLARAALHNLVVNLAVAEIAFNFYTIGKIWEKHCSSEWWKNAGRNLSNMSKWGLFGVLGIYGGLKYAAGSGNITTLTAALTWNKHPAGLVDEASAISQKLSFIPYAGHVLNSYHSKTKEAYNKAKEFICGKPGCSPLVQ